MLVEVKNVSYRYEASKRFSLDNVNLSIKRGEVLAIVGKNGSGKTTLAKLIMRLLKPTSGEIYIDSVNLERLSSREIAAKIGLVFQNPLHQLFCDSVGEEIAFGLRNTGVPGEEIERRVSASLIEHELLTYRDRHPLAISEGQRKRLALASILAMDPDFVILDEPTLGQDLRQQERLKALLSDLSMKGKGVAIISHDMEFVSETAHRIVALLSGKIVASEASEKFLFNEALLQKCGLISPSIPRIARLLSMSPTLSEEEVLSKLKKMRMGQNVPQAQI